MIVKILISLCCSFIFSQHFQVDLNPTGLYELVIISSSVTGLDEGDEIGIFDSAGVSQSCIPELGCDTSLITYEEVLVGAGTWESSSIAVIFCNINFDTFNASTENTTIFFKRVRSINSCFDVCI